MKAILASLLALTAAAQAGPRTSSNYTVPTDTADAGGRRTTSADYTNDGSLGGVTGISTVASPAETAKHGYVGQLYEVTGLTLTAASLDVDEGATGQLAASQDLDDATFLAVPATSVAWSVQSGPLTGIDVGGLATAGIVYQNTAATAQGDFGGFTGTLGLTVVNLNPDNLPGYAADGIDDDWQVGFFGAPPNADAGPGQNPDGDTNDNRMEFLTGFDPTDPTQFFCLTIVGKTGSTVDMEINKAIPGRTYRILESGDLATVFSEIGSFTMETEEIDKSIQDTAAPAGRNFYRVEISKP